MLYFVYMTLVIRAHKRESSFELIRIIAQILIVVYHILGYIVYPMAGVDFYKAIWFPLHIGVPLFVLISGYFGIKSSVKGFVKFVSLVFVLQIPYIIQEALITEGGAKTIFGYVPFFISRTRFWFIRTYVFLYLLSPVINKYLKDINLTQRLLLLGSLFWISDYIGMLGSDGSLLNGKNVVTFLLYYSIGNTLSYYKTKWENWNSKYLLAIFITINIIVIGFFSFFGFESILGQIWRRVFFAYCSPLLLGNAILVFLILGKMKVKSTFINNVAKASLTIYIIHETFVITVIKPVVIWLYEMNNCVPCVLAEVFFVTIISVILCVIFYWMLTPLWKLIERFSNSCQLHLEKLKKI